MRKSTLVAVLGVAAIGLASGSAFTGGGLSDSVPDTSFVGGTVSQTYTGATLTAVAYEYTNLTNKEVDQATLTFAEDALGKAVAIAFKNGATPTGTFTCSLVAETAVDSDVFTSTCDASGVLFAVDVTSAAITVS